MKRADKLTIIGILFSLIGTLGVAPTLYYRTQNTVAASPQQIIIPAAQPAPSPNSISGKPAQLIISGLNLSLEVADGTYNTKNGQWTLSNNKAHFALLSAQPNNTQGNTLIYGHYRPEVFARLKKLVPGQEATVVTDNGYRFTYVYKSTRAVEPTDASIFAYTGAPMLTLQTCSGAWMQNRQLYGFDFVRYEKV